MKKFALPEEARRSESEKEYFRKYIRALSDKYLSEYLGPRAGENRSSEGSTWVSHAVWATRSVLNRWWIARGRPLWRVSAADVLDADDFLKKMQHLRDDNKSKYDELCRAISDRTEIVVVSFDLPRTSEMKELPSYVVGRSLVVVCDRNEIKPLWSMIDFLLA